MKKTILALLFVALTSTGLTRAQDLPYAANYQKVKFEQFYDALNSLYVDTLNNAQLIEKAIVSILADLDPHSTYSSAEEMKAIKES